MSVEVSSLSHRYGDRVALADVSFSVRPGEIFGLAGPNGSGKTTLFRILATALAPSVGSARVAGADLSDPAAVRRRIGVVFQTPALDLKLTAHENLVHHGWLYGLRGRLLRKRVRELLERFGLAERADERVETLSGGLRRRVELAKALLHEPEVLLLDEPSGSLDPGARRDLWDRLRALRGVTVLLTTHLMEEADRCDRLGILHRGRLVALGAPAELRAEVGGDVVTVRARDAAALAAALRERFGVAAEASDGVVRLSRERGHEFVSALYEAFPDRIEAVTVARPSLEDVFHLKTREVWS
ncbi:MAG TPA: ABC transporter ATP-binding protein [Planctomycetota bacterium]|nr:ABC transporter ATP-binding protein [Planctomycetota bacterium]